MRGKGGLCPKPTYARLSGDKFATNLWWSLYLSPKLVKVLVKNLVKNLVITILVKMVSQNLSPNFVISKFITKFLTVLDNKFSEKCLGHKIWWQFCHQIPRWLLFQYQVWDWLCLAVMRQVLMCFHCFQKKGMIYCWHFIRNSLITYVSVLLERAGPLPQS